MDKNAKIYVAGHTGVLGSAIVRELQRRGYGNLLLRTHGELDLCRQEQTERFFAAERPQYVFFAAAKVAGISYRQNHPAEMLLHNMQITVNVLSAAFKYDVQKLINVSSALLYPDKISVPTEDDVEFVALKQLDTPYALAKATGERLCSYYRQEYDRNFITAVPCNLYGLGTSFDTDRAGMLPSLIHRIYTAKKENLSEVKVWGTGKARRDVLFADDVADACIFLMNNDCPFSLINIGSGREYSVAEIAENVKDSVGYEGKLVFDATRPEGRQHMELNTERITNMGWRPKYSLQDGIKQMIQHYEIVFVNKFK